jgi:hypothetical protein
VAHDGELNVDCSMAYHCITRPINFESVHEHKSVELLCFMGGNPLDITDFGAEIEVSLGEEQEKHFVNAPVVISIPAGLKHCPINVKKVTKPIVFLEITLNSKFGDGKPRRKPPEK